MPPDEQFEGFRVANLDETLQQLPIAEPIGRRRSDDVTQTPDERVEMSAAMMLTLPHRFPSVPIEAESRPTFRGLTVFD